MGKETEIKFHLTPEQYRIHTDLFSRNPRHVQTLEMETTYYDTPSGSLSARHWTLRRRMEGGSCVCTVKTPLGDHCRGEWECQCDDILAAILELCKLGAPAELAVLAREGLIPICGARFTRQALKAQDEDTVVELALDQGVLTGGGREEPFQELEFELKSGCEARMRAMAAAHAARMGLWEEPRSKFARALSLAKEGSHGQL